MSPVPTNDVKVDNNEEALGIDKRNGDNQLESVQSEDIELKRSSSGAAGSCPVAVSLL